MKLLENIFLILTILIPLFLIGLMICKIKTVKKKKTYRNRLLTLVFLSVCINGIIFMSLRLYNEKIENKPPEHENKNENKTDEPDRNDDPNQIDDPSSDPSTSTTTTTTTTTKKPTTATTTTKSNNSTTVSGGVTSKGFKVEVIDGITYIDGYLVVNKTYSLPSTYVPTGTHKKVSSEICQECIVEEAYAAFTKMRNDASSAGLNIWIQSGYRSYSYQGGLYNSYVKRNGKEAADTFSARPGHSEHQSGYAFDLNTITDAFANTKEGKWVNENCYKYGFILRYPKGKDGETGYKYESWHLRYVGLDLANKLYNAGDWITMEAYFGITSEYSN